jgi:putative ABC transport system permease protein
LRGDNAKILDPASVVLTASLAEKLFGKADPIGRILSVDVLGKEEPFVVGAIVEDVPNNSHFTFNMLVPFQALYRTNLAIKNHQFWTYILLPKGYRAAELESKLPAFALQYHGDEDVKKSRLRYELQPLKSIYFGEEGAPNQGDRRYVTIFSAIALLILLIACANFMNLAIARSFKRTKEVGVRKVMGAQRRQLIAQFLGESILFCCIAIPLALVLVELTLPIVTALAEKEIVLDLKRNTPFLSSLLCVILFVGLVSGSYPAMFLSAYQPEAVLKGRHLGRLKGAALRKGLIVFQFFISIALVAGTFVMQRQLHFIQNQKLGFNKEQVVVIPLQNALVRQNSAAFKNELLRHSSIISATACAGVPTQRAFAGMIYDGVRVEGVAEGIKLHVATVDEDFLKTLEMELAAGRDFSAAFKTDESEAFLINETAVKTLGLPTAEDALGKRLNLGMKVGPIVGVVKDFHFESLHRRIEPFLLHINREYFWAIAVRIQPNNLPSAMAFIEKEWKAFAPNIPFEFSFLDEQINSLYRREQRIKQIFFYFSMLAVFLASLGLLGLVAFSAEQRTKEIGIRKVLGASVPGIIGLLSKEFVQLVITAMLIASPIAYFTMNRWLQNFAYRIDISWWMFAFAGGMALLIALLTVSTQAIKAALANPVEALRYE